MIFKTGNILECDEYVIIQQVNCMNRMGTGLAKAIYTKWPKVKKEFHRLWKRNAGKYLFGTIQVVELPGKIVINSYSQYSYGYDGTLYTNYQAVWQCFSQALDVMDKMCIDQIAIPYNYGCGLGGGDWAIVSETIDEVFGDRAVIYKLEDDDAKNND